MNFYGFYTGQEFEAYQYLGAHTVGKGTTFRTFAPAAEKISVIGEFSDWKEIPMEKVYDGNFWECTVPKARRGQMYKYRITDSTGKVIDHCDPYAFSAEVRPGTASVIWGLPARKPKHLADGGKSDPLRRPMNIYEIHAGSWRKPAGGEREFYTYRELAGLLVPYLKENQFTHLELMPLNEHPCDESWGYQATGFFSPTSRYGTPDDLRYLIRQCHQAGIGVLLDFVPVHFAVNDYALLHYDGTALYEYPHRDVSYNEWGSCNFMHSRGEVRSFLQSSAYYWLKEFGFDGLRMDAIRNLIYWQGDEAKGENKLTIQFLKTMNSGLKERCPQAVLIAEDSTTYPGVTAPVKDGGLGFDCKWDLGWMNDTLAFLKLPPEQRTEKYHSITFSMQYFYDEKYLLPLSHDEVVHGKATIIQKTAGDNYEDKFAQVRLLYMYMFAHPGKKLNFMGNELGMFREWDEKKELDWDLLKYPQHDGFYHFFRELNRLCRRNSAFYELDYDRKGFEWVDCHDEKHATYSFLRRSKDRTILAVFHFGGKDREICALPVAGYRRAELILDSDWEEYGGTTPRKEWTQSIAKGTLTTKLRHYSAQYFRLK